MQGVSGTPLTGSYNTAVGNTALGSLQGAATDNVAVGASALAYASTGDYNTAIGTQAGEYISTGTANTAIGAEA